MKDCVVNRLKQILKEGCWMKNTGKHLFSYCTLCLQISGMIQWGSRLVNLEKSVCSVVVIYLNMTCLKITFDNVCLQKRKPTFL